MSLPALLLEQFCVLVRAVGFRFFFRFRTLIIMKHELIWETQSKYNCAQIEALILYYYWLKRCFNADMYFRQLKYNLSASFAKF